MPVYGKQFWRAAPFIRLLIPLTAGIVLSYYLSISITATIITAAISSIMFIFFRFVPSTYKYKLRWINGLSFNFIIIAAGTALMYFQNIEHDTKWIGHYANKTNLIAVTLQESLLAKANSYKALAKMESVFVNGEWIKVKGNVLLYFKKDNTPIPLQYGSQIIIQKTLQPIINSSNPGAFDYKQYCAFQDIHYQVYLHTKDYVITHQLQINILSQLLINTRSNVLSLFRKWVPGQTETGVAEALLIGYRDDLDKDLVRAYSNTGVVHIIAISGLHLGMIYGLLLLIFKPFRKYKWIVLIKPIFILSVIWGFTLLAGAVPSILRSAVMFSFIVIGESLGRRTNIYNTLAASAFCLLVVNPYFFWDVGFQLSYTAVLSIVLFMKPIYKQFYFKNKLLNSVWQLNAITLSAQILTLPIILYYFHQFPNLFLFTNFIAVPLSGFILYAELLLLVVYKITFLNMYTGKTISFLINQMNGFIERTNSLSFAVTDNIQINTTQTILLYFAISCFSWWLIKKQPKGLMISLCFLLPFYIINSIQSINRKNQQKLIIYHIPQKTAIDIIEGTKYRFWGDSSLTGRSSLANYHLQPARLIYGVSETDYLPNTIISDKMIIGPRKSVLVIDQSFHFSPSGQKIPVDIIILSGNPKLYLGQIATVFTCSQYVFDSSNPMWKIQYWKKDADSLHLRHHTISEQGAFEMDL